MSHSPTAAAAASDTRARVERLKSALRAPFDTKKPIQVQVATNLNAAKRLRDRGWCPIECSAGPESIVDERQLDHHGSLSHLPGVAVRGYHEQYGGRADDPRFVFLGFPDEDATFCAASLAAQVPHPILAEVFPDLPERQYAIVSQNLGHLAELINRVDIDKDAGKTLDDTAAGRTMLLWRQLAHPTRSNEPAWWGGLDRWTTLTTKDLRIAHHAAVELQHDQMDRVLGAEHVLFGRSNQVAVADFSGLGRNSIFYDHWNAHRTPVLVAFFSDLGVCSIVLRSMEWAREHVGPNGLLHLYSRLEPKGSGGREVLGGTDRFSRLNWDGAKRIGEQLAHLIDEIESGSLTLT